MSDLLNIVSASDKRRNLLILLNTGPKEWDEIKQTLKVTATGMLPQVKILEEEHLIERDGKLFTLTPLGKILTIHMIPLLATMEVMDKHKKFWQTHNVDVLPLDILLDIRDLGNYRIIENSDEEIFDINTFLTNLAQSKTLRGMSHTIHPRYPNFFLDLAKKGVETSLILTPGVYKIVKEKYPEQLQTFLDCPSATLYVSDTDLKFSFAVSDIYFSISLFYNNGMFDSKNDVVSNDASALRWGERIYSYLIAQSKKVDSLD